MAKINVSLLVRRSVLSNWPFNMSSLLIFFCLSLFSKSVSYEYGCIDEKDFFPPESPRQCWARPVTFEHSTRCCHSYDYCNKDEKAELLKFDSSSNSLVPRSSGDVSGKVHLLYPNQPHCTNLVWLALTIIFLKIIDFTKVWCSVLTLRSISITIAI